MNKHMKKPKKHKVRIRIYADYLYEDILAYSRREAVEIASERAFNEYGETRPEYPEGKEIKT